MSKRLITVRSGKEEIQMEVTEEEYQKYYRPWWLQKKREQRNREAMEEHGYREESYEQWKENDMKSELFSDSLEELTEKKEMLGILQEALESLMREEKELVKMVFGEEMQVSEYGQTFKRYSIAIGMGLRNAANSKTPFDYSKRGKIDLFAK